MRVIKLFYTILKDKLRKKTPVQKVLARIHWQEFRGLRFKAGLSGSGPLYTAYHPDSYYAFQAHPEFDELFRRFSEKNAWNNGGDTARIWSFILNCKQVLGDGIQGDFAELGVWRGNTSAILARFAAPEKRKVFLFDTFEGFPKEDLTGIDATKDTDFNNTSIELVKEVIGENINSCVFVKGFFPDTVTDEHRSGQYAIVSLDCDLYAPTKAGLAFFYERMPRGGIFFLHDYSSLHWDGSKKAIDEFCREHDEYIVLMPDKCGSAFFRKSK